MFLLNATKSCLNLVAGKLLVAGSVNVHEVKFEFSDDWSDLVKTVTFRTVSDSRSVILNDEGECVIPWEVLKDSSPYLYVGLIGTRDAEVVLPTIWADLGEVRNGTKPGADVTDPTPTVYEQVLSELGSRANNLTVKDEKLQLRSGETVLSEVELPKQEEPCTTDHAALLNRDAADQHPIEAITGLADALKDKLTKDDVDLVLAQAKESGEFDGKDGHTPVKGKDYYTEAEKAELVEEVLEQIPEQPSDGISVDKAEIGQTIVVKAVDENGKPTEWEAADLPEGGAAIIDVVELPTENIEEDVFYRLLTGRFIVNQMERNQDVIYFVESLPTVGEAALSGSLSDTDSVVVTAYYNTIDGSVSAYVNSTLSAAFRVPVGWYPAATLLSAVGYTFGGVITDVLQNPASGNIWNLLLSYGLYSYKDRWTEQNRVGRHGTASSAEAFNHLSNEALGRCSHAEGQRTTASGANSHAEGFGTTASGNESHAEGFGTTASGNDSHAEGFGTTASGNDSHAEGLYTVASGGAQHVQGRHNIEDTDNKYAHIVGNGGYDGSGNQIRSNAHTLDWSGLGWFAGGLKVGGTGQDDEASRTVMVNGDTQIVLTSPNGTKFAITVSDDGTLTATAQ